MYTAATRWENRIWQTERNERQAGRGRVNLGIWLQKAVSYVPITGNTFYLFCVWKCAHLFPLSSIPLPPLLFPSVIDSLKFEEKLREKSFFLFFFLVINYKLSNLEKENFLTVGAYEKFGFVSCTKDFLYSVVGKNQITGVNTETVYCLEIMLRAITLWAITQKTFI